PVPDLVPARLVEFGSSRRALQLADDALAHFRGGLPRELNRQYVARLDARLQQVDVAPDEDRRLAGAGRGLQHDVLMRIDGERPSRGVRVAGGWIARARIADGWWRRHLRWGRLGHDFVAAKERQLRDGNL